MVGLIAHTYSYYPTDQLGPLPLPDAADVVFVEGKRGWQAELRALWRIAGPVMVTYVLMTSYTCVLVLQESCPVILQEHATARELTFKGSRHCLLVVVLCVPPHPRVCFFFFLRTPSLCFHTSSSMTPPPPCSQVRTSDEPWQYQCRVCWPYRAQGSSDAGVVLLWCRSDPVLFLYYFFNAAVTVMTRASSVNRI
jgi:hypothetical protein